MVTKKNVSDREETHCAEKAFEVPRRNFLKFSGAALTAGLTGVPFDDVLADRSSLTDQLCDPSATVWCKTRPDPKSLCGSTDDDDPLWKIAQGCASHAGGNCRSVPGSNNDYIVVDGKTANNDYLLLPTCRITGIECPMIWKSGAPNFWKGALEGAKLSSVAPKQPYGFGINSKDARKRNQLHIHIAPLQNGSVKILPQLTALKKKIVTDKRDWINCVIVVKGVEPNGPKDRPYRALWIQDLDHNMFEYLYAYIATPMGQQEKMDPDAIMPYENLVVIPEDPKTGTGFYVLNSDGRLEVSNPKMKGISSVDQLFYGNA
jgi:CDP-diacylglycerol pyrophosphatase